MRQEDTRRGISLRRKVTILVLLTFAVFEVAEYSIHRFVVFPSFVSLERDEAMKDLARAHDALQREIEHLELICGDWAAWDDSYAFVDEVSEDFIEGSLLPGVLVGAELNVVHYYDRNGDLVWGSAVDDEGNGLVVSQLAANSLQPDHIFIDFEDEEDSVSGILMTDHGPMLIAAMPILTSASEGPINGALVMGRILSEDRVEAIVQRTRVQMDLWPVDADGMPEDVNQAIARFDENARQMLGDSSQGKLLAYALLDDIAGKPALVVRATIPKRISARGETAMWYALLSALPLGAVLLLMLQSALQHTVVKPVAALTQQVIRVRETDDLTARLRLNRDDEVGTLAGEFDHMVENLALSRELLLDAKKDAEASSEAKSAFLANMSHEIRTPMSAILGYADLVMDPTQPAEERANCARVIKRNGEHLLKLINDILDLSKVEAGRMSTEQIECSPVQVVRDVQSMMRARASGKGIELAIEFDGPVPEKIKSDPTRLRQILVNLVGNAIKFTEAGGVCVRVGFEGEPFTKTAGLRFDVIDSGIGLEPEQVSRLFKPFSQADSSISRRFGGTGLGLAISSRLASMLGGKLSVTSEIGKGSTFTLTVAANMVEGAKMLDSPAEAVWETEAENTSKDADIKLDGRILLAEDGPDNQRLISFHLRRAGAMVDIAENGRVAVSRALLSHKAGEPYDLILMDIQMPELDGYAATAQLRKSGWTGAIVALTAHAMAGDEQKCLEAGCDGYASKPINRIALLKTCAKWLDNDKESRAA